MKDLKKEAIDRVCSKLEISIEELEKKLILYNKRAFELNEKTIKFAQEFLFSKKENNKETYVLNEDDKTILLGYKKKTLDTLKKEFPELTNKEILKDLKYFETDLNL